MSRLETGKRADRLEVGDQGEVTSRVVESLLMYVSSKNGHNWLFSGQTLNSEPVEARPVSALESSIRWLAGNRRAKADVEAPLRTGSDFPQRTYEIPDHLCPRSILLLEDDLALASSLKDALELNNFRVRHVINGVEGLKLVLSHDFDLILCDMAMPGFPGDMFYLAVERSRPQFCSRFLFMTGHTGDPRILEFVRRVRGLLLWKPFQFHDLMEALNAVLKKPLRNKAAAPVAAEGVVEPELARAG